jgi:TetR/AcrR family transcriptional regulator of autoinduction and epiphytic fitness
LGRSRAPYTSSPLFTKKDGQRSLLSSSLGPDRHGHVDENEQSVLAARLRRTKLPLLDSRTTSSKDGRTVRAERTRQAIVDALFTLLDDGELRPTAERIAERAGVSERSVFQHFPDREALFEAVARQQYERLIAKIKPVDASRALPERLDALVAQRTRLLEQTSSVRRAALLLEHESDVVAGWLESWRRGAASEVERIFRRELEEVEAGERAVLLGALVSATSWPVWESYRVHQRMGVERARAAMRRTLAALLGER